MGLDVVVQKLLGNLYNENEIESRFSIKTIMAKSTLITNKSVKLFQIPNKINRQEDILSCYRYYCDYLNKRGISEDTAIKYDIGYDKTNNQITFPLRNKDGNVLGIGRRSIQYKRYEYPKGMIKPVYGIYELPERIRSLFIVEGPFNLWSLSEWNKNGIALLGTGTENQYLELIKIDTVNYVLALDPDEAGRRGIKKLINFLVKNHKYNIYVLMVPVGKDVNDLTFEEFKNTEVMYYKNWLSLFEEIQVDE